ncbi:HAD family hydrolase [Streptomyces sp. NA04227]|uniref:HAD family hydrolase n=1 Tax=Streptomyces sp. NA04227 TaxID=2742136 RepID=UPI0015915A35|nr:HAD family hydrolase [Streptomyces sp. NA04227]QKW09407.1 HAD family hydrolase [Streptomyces sp. NA04227]
MSSEPAAPSAEPAASAPPPNPQDAAALPATAVIEPATVPEPIEAVVWDIDDTLFDYAGADLAGLRAHLGAEGLLDLHGSTEAALAEWQRLTRIHWARCESGEVDFLTQRRDRVREFLTSSLDDDGIDAWFAGYAVHYEAAWALFPDVLPALEALSGRYRHAVLSNSALSTQEYKLATLGLRDRFEAVLCAVDLGVSKPEPGAFHAVGEALGLAPARIAYVGDQPDTDARGARDAGMLGIWLDRTNSPSATPSGVHRITSLAELEALLGTHTRFGAPSTFG